MEKSKEFFEFKKKLDFLKAQRGEGTELISVYLKANGNVADTVNRLRDEYSQSMNIKSKRTRKNVQDAIDRILQALKGVHKSPENGVAIFSGSLNEKIEIFMVIPPSPANVQIYRCDSTFYLDPLLELVAPQDIYGLFVMDRREATVAMLRGKQLEILIHMTSNVPGKHHKGGQCLAPDTLIMSADGGIKEIEKLNKNDCVKCANLTEKTTEDTLIMDKWKTAKQDVYTISTKYPSMEIVCSGDHGFFVRNCSGIEETPAKKLTKTHTLLMPESIVVEGTEQVLSTEYYNAFKIKSEGFAEFKGKYIEPNEDVILPSKLIPAVAQFIGYFMGDGNFDKNRVCFSEENAQVIKKYEKITRELFTKQTGLRHRANKNYWELRVYSKTLAEWLQNEIVRDKKEIPEKILLSKNNVVAAFLRGFFDAEGYVSGGRLALGINNKKLAKQIQLVLLRFGIIASIHVYDNRRNPYSKKNRYTVGISELESLKFFLENIGFTSKKKVTKLISIINERKKRKEVSRTRRLLITGKEIRKVIEKHGWNMQRFPHVVGSPLFQNKREISKTAFSRSLLEPAKPNLPLYSELKNLLNHKIIPVKIKEIKKIRGKMEMVDICTDKQNFMANGLIVHNSALRFERLIEQSAEDFYKKICEHLNQMMRDPKIRGVIAGGPGATKNEVVNSDKLSIDVKKKIIGVLDTSYTDEYGIKELIDRSGDILKNMDVQKEKGLVNRFIKDAVTGGPATYGLADVKEALEIGKVDILLLSEKLDEKTISELSMMADDTDVVVEMISVDTPEGEQFYSGFHGIGAILRYK